MFGGSGDLIQSRSGHEHLPVQAAAGRKDSGTQQLFPEGWIHQEAGKAGGRGKPRGTEETGLTPPGLPVKHLPPTVVLIRNHNTAITSPGAANEVESWGL